MNLNPVKLFKLSLSAFNKRTFAKMFALDKKFKVLVAHPQAPTDALQLLEANNCELVKVSEKLPTKRSEILEKVKGVDALYWCCYDPLNAEILDAAGPQVKAASVMTAGVDYVDILEFQKRKIPLGHTPRVVNEAVADLAIGLMIAAARRFYEGRLKIETSTWVTDHIDWMWGREIRDSVVGFYGFGNIAESVAQRLKGFDIERIIYTTRRRVTIEKEMAHNASHVCFPDLLANSDILFIITPLTKETAGVFNAEAFSKMKKTAVIINVARGGVVCQKDLYEALKNNTIFAAGLDVMTPEPLPKDDPLLTLPNCVLIPHLGTATGRTTTEMAILAAHNVLRGLAGKPMIASVF